MMSLSVLTARETVVCSIGWNCGSPWYCTSGAFTCFLSTRAVCGICASRTASAASSVPGTEASTRDRSCESGIFLKSSGRVGRRERPRPVEAGAVNQRPETRKYTGPVLAEPEDVAVGVGDPEQARAGHRQIVRRAAQQNQLRRRRADEHLGRRRQRAAGQRRLHVLPVVVGGQLREARPAACPPASTVP